MELHEPMCAPWLPPLRGRALRASSGEGRDALVEALRHALVDWARNWGLAASSLQLACTAFAGGSETGGPWHTLRDGEGALAGWLHAPPAEALLQNLLSGAQRTGVLAQAVCQSCVDDAALQMTTALGLQQDAAGELGPPSVEASPWSGALQVDVTVRAGADDAPRAWRLVLSGTGVSAWWSRTGRARAKRQRIGPRSAVVPVAQALASCRITLQARLEGCELELGALRTLALGNVVRCRHALVAPAMLSDRQGQPCLAGYLVNQAGRRALELARLPENFQKRRAA